MKSYATLGFTFGGRVHEITTKVQLDNSSDPALAWHRIAAFSTETYKVHVETRSYIEDRKGTSPLY